MCQFGINLFCLYDVNSQNFHCWLEKCHTNLTKPREKALPFVVGHMLILSWRGACYGLVSYSSFCLLALPNEQTNDRKICLSRLIVVIDILQPSVFLIEQMSSACIAGRKFSIQNLLKGLGLRRFDLISINRAH